MTRYLGEILCEEIVTAFAEAIVVGPTKALVQANVDAFIDRAMAAYPKRHLKSVSAAEVSRWRQYAIEIVDDAGQRGCIESGTGATAFIIFAFAYGACLMKSGEFNSTAMKGAMAAVDDHLCGVWRQAGDEMAPSTRPSSMIHGYRKTE